MEPTASTLTIPAFLKVLTTGGMSVTKAMEITPKIFKQYNTPEKLSALADEKLVQLGVLKKEDRKQVLSALRKAGYSGAGRSPESKPSPKKRKREDDGINGPSNKKYTESSLTFQEVTDEKELTHSVVVNRAPIMTAWAMVVAERLGFQHEEALSIASVYTEMNAVSKGKSLGIFDKGKGKNLEASSSGSQPYVDLMGRRPLFLDRNKQWRALSEGSPSPPASAHNYIRKGLHRTTPYIIGAMRLLARSFPPQELNQKGFGLYADFRPEVEQWGGKGTVKCDSILRLRKKGEKHDSDMSTPAVGHEGGTAQEAAQGMISEVQEVSHREVSDTPP